MGWRGSFYPSAPRRNRMTRNNGSTDRQAGIIAWAIAGFARASPSRGGSERLPGSEVFEPSKRAKAAFLLKPRPSSEKTPLPNAQRSRDLDHTAAPRLRSPDR